MSISNIYTKGIQQKCIRGLFRILSPSLESHHRVDHLRNWLKETCLGCDSTMLKSLDEAISTTDVETIVKPVVVIAINLNSMDFKQRANLFEALGMQRLPRDLMTLVALLRILCDSSVTDLKILLI